jgi:hypothetical protein
MFMVYVIPVGTIGRKEELEVRRNVHTYPKQGFQHFVRLRNDVFFFLLFRLA